MTWGRTGGTLGTDRSGRDRGGRCQCRKSHRARLGRLQQEQRAACGCRQGDEAALARGHVGRDAHPRECLDWIPGPGKGEGLRYQATEMASSWAGRTLSQRLNSHAISSLLLGSHGAVPVAQECSAL